MNTKLATTQIRLQNWALTIKDRQSSGLSVKDYCEQHSISKDAYYYWLRKVKEAALAESGFVEMKQPDPLQVVPASPDVVPDVIKLQIRDLQISVPMSVPKEVFTMIIEAASHAE
jgi:hypothetical protein